MSSDKYFTHNSFVNVYCAIRGNSVVWIVWRKSKGKTCTMTTSCLYVILRSLRQVLCMQNPSAFRHLYFLTQIFVVHTLSVRSALAIVGKSQGRTPNTRTNWVLVVRIYQSEFRLSSISVNLFIDTVKQAPPYTKTHAERLSGRGWKQHTSFLPWIHISYPMFELACQPTM